MCQKCIKALNREQVALKETIKALDKVENNHVAKMVSDGLKKAYKELEEEKQFHLSQMN